MNKKLSIKEKAYKQFCKDLQKEHIKPLITIKNEKVF
jgi:hypothetical protein